MKKDIEEYISQCQNCQKVEVVYQHPTRLLEPSPNPEWKWEVNSMDFIIGWMMTVNKSDSIVVMVENLSNVVH